jgi:hypothetical protein
MVYLEAMSSIGGYVGGIVVVTAAVLELLVLGIVRLVRARLGQIRIRRAVRQGRFAGKFAAVKRAYGANR